MPVIWSSAGRTIWSQGKIHNVARKSWLRAVGNAVGLILAIPTGLYSLMFVALIIEGVPAV